MKTIIKMFVWKYIGAYGNQKHECTYQWVMQAPIYKIPLRLWCVKHHINLQFEQLYDWLTKT